MSIKDDEGYPQWCEEHKTGDYCFEKQMGDHFYFVYRANAGSPTKKHPNLTSAQTEASRLAAKYNSRIYILECIGFVEPISTPTKYTEVKPK